MNDTDTKILENRLRATLKRRGYALHKARARDPMVPSYGRYQITPAGQEVEYDTYSLTLDDVEQAVNAWVTLRDHGRIIHPLTVGVVHPQHPGDRGYHVLRIGGANAVEIVTLHESDDIPDDERAGRVTAIRMPAVIEGRLLWPSLVRGGALAVLIDLIIDGQRYDGMARRYILSEEGEQAADELTMLLNDEVSFYTQCHYRIQTAEEWFSGADESSEDMLRRLGLKVDINDSDALHAAAGVLVEEARKCGTLLDRLEVYDHLLGAESDVRFDAVCEEAEAAAEDMRAGLDANTATHTVAIDLTVAELCEAECKLANEIEVYGGDHHPLCAAFRKISAAAEAAYPERFITTLVAKWRRHLGMPEAMAPTPPT